MTPLLIRLSLYRSDRQGRSVIQCFMLINSLIRFFFLSYLSDSLLRIVILYHCRPLQNWNAGMLAGVCTTVIMAPGERIKCLLQVAVRPF